MPTSPPSDGAARSAEALQAEIRALLVETGGWLWGPTRDRYEQLRDEWVRAVRNQVTTAA
ncbi:hypothetical protein [Streptomyces sp. NPDC006610]|uniref:hypothetical protein n=1 Tax=Streptomyces sp. NPDC006610 TaxID=3154584 RepID=UPI0033A5B789